MDYVQIIFIVISTITLLSAVFVVTNRNLFHAALFMMLSFLGVAGLYVLLESGFMAATQLLVYIGAISILIIFAIMMTRRLMQTTESPYNTQWSVAGVSAGLLFVLLAGVFIQATPAANYQAYEQIREVIDGQVVTLGHALVDEEQYVLPFLLSSVLLLAALVGSIIVARPDMEEVE